MTKALIIGAGAAGLVLARELTKSGQNQEIPVLEKSRGIGGRLATRRGDHCRFDHGIPAITPEEHTLLRLNPADIPNEGATATAKLLAQNLAIEKNTRAIELVPGESGWLVKSECGKNCFRRDRHSHGSAATGLGASGKKQHPLFSRAEGHPV